jgi:hypothetical protein
MSDQLLQIGEKFWNVRGSYRIAGLLNVGTQMSLVRLHKGGYVLLDSYRLEADIRERLLSLTDGGREVTAVLNLHPFHTMHVRSIATQFPDAKLYGTRRHVARADDLRWEACHTEDPELGELFADDFVFSVPRGVDFIPENEKLHFASVLAFHLHSKTLHVDDTLTWVPLPIVGGLKFHPALGSVLQKRAGAVAEFRQWTAELTRLCANVEHRWIDEPLARRSARRHREDSRRARKTFRVMQRDAPTFMKNNERFPHSHVQRP